MNKGNHEKMIVWQMADTLDVGVQRLLKTIPRHEYSLKGQIDSASDSIASNFVEGYYSGSVKEYLRFLRYARRSCAELQERIRRVNRKGYSSPAVVDTLIDQTIRTGYLLDRLIYSLLERKSSSPS